MHSGTDWCTHLVLSAGFIEMGPMSLESSQPNLLRDWLFIYAIPKAELKGFQLESS